MFLDSIYTELVRRQAFAGTLVHERAKPPRTEGTVHVNFTTVAFTMQRQPESTPARVGFVAPRAHEPPGA